MNTTNAASLGKFIVLDGCEGAGKTTQIKKLKEKYGDAVVFTREPGGSPYAEKIRNLILHDEFAKDADAETLMLLFWAARAEHMHALIRPALEAGKMVVCDRFDSSTFSYQIAGQQHERLKPLFLALRASVLKDIAPDHYIVMDIDPAQGLARKHSQAQAGNDERNHFDDRALEFHTRVREGYRAFSEATGASVQFVDASRSVDAIFDDLIAVLES